MTDHISFEDQELLARLGRIARSVDPVPDFVTELSRAALGFRDLDAELATLVNDSAAELVAVRGVELDERLLEFASSELTIEVQISAAGPKRSVLGQIRSKRAEDCDVEVVAESSLGPQSPPVHVDRQGRFSIEAVPSGSLRLRCTGAGSSVLLTPWFSILKTSTD